MTVLELVLQGTKVNSRGQEVPQHVRLYSIASSRYGDSGDGNTCTLCVVRVIYNGAAPSASTAPSQLIIVSDMGTYTSLATRVNPAGGCRCLMVNAISLAGLLCASKLKCDFSCYMQRSVFTHLNPVEKPQQS
mgnify:FL=1